MEVAAPSDDAPSSRLVAGGSQTSAVSSVLRDVGYWPTADRILVRALPLGAIPVLEPRPETEPLRLPASIGAPMLGLTEWTMGSSVVHSVAREVDVATNEQLSKAPGVAFRRVKRLACDLSGFFWSSWRDCAAGYVPPCHRPTRLVRPRVRAATTSQGYSASRPGGGVQLPCGCGRCGRCPSSTERCHGLRSLAGARTLSRRWLRQSRSRHGGRLRFCASRRLRRTSHLRWGISHACSV